MAKAFTTEQKKERIRLAVEIYKQTGAWKDAEKIAHRQNVEKQILCQTLGCLKTCVH